MMIAAQGNGDHTSASGPESPPLGSISNEPVLLGVGINAETSQLSILSTSPPNAVDRLNDGITYRLRPSQSYIFFMLRDVRTSSLLANHTFRLFDHSVPPNPIVDAHLTPTSNITWTAVEGEFALIAGESDEDPSIVTLPQQARRVFLLVQPIPPAASMLTRNLIITAAVLIPIGACCVGCYCHGGVCRPKDVYTFGKKVRAGYIVLVGLVTVCGSIGVLSLAAVIAWFIFIGIPGLVVSFWECCSYKKKVDVALLDGSGVDRISHVCPILCHNPRWFTEAITWPLNWCDRPEARANNADNVSMGEDEGLLAIDIADPNQSPPADNPLEPEEEKLQQDEQKQEHAYEDVHIDAAEENQDELKEEKALIEGEGQQEMSDEAGKEEEGQGEGEELAQLVQGNGASELEDLESDDGADVQAGVSEPDSEWLPHDAPYPYPDGNWQVGFASGVNHQLDLLPADVRHRLYGFISFLRLFVGEDVVGWAPTTLKQMAKQSRHSVKCSLLELKRDENGALSSGVSQINESGIDWQPQRITIQSGGHVYFVDGVVSDTVRAWLIIDCGTDPVRGSSDCVHDGNAR